MKKDDKRNQLSGVDKQVRGIIITYDAYMKDEYKHVGGNDSKRIRK